MLVCLAVERWRAVVRPMQGYRSPSSLLVIGWAASLLPSLPCLLIFRTQHGAECVSTLGSWSTMARKSYIFLLPLLTLATLYMSILCQLANNIKDSGRARRQEQGLTESSPQVWNITKEVDTFSPKSKIWQQK